MKKIDLSGKQFDYLKVLNQSFYKDKRTYWLCECICGKEIYKSYNDLVCNKSKKSCGCKRYQTIKEKNIKHNMCYTSEYKSYAGMKERCLNKNNNAYKNYGGRGIKICKRWLESFENFYKDMGKKPSKNHSLDRINNNGNYSPKNCRWATPQEQSENKRSNIILKLNDKEIKALEILPKEIRETTYQRIRNGMDFKTAINMPIKKHQVYLIDNEYLTVKQISNKFNIKRNTFEYRIRKGWSPELAAKAPLGVNQYSKATPH